MINPAHVVEHLVKLVRTRFGDDNQSPPTDEERELANHLFEIIIELDNGTAVLETDWTLTHDTDGHDTVEEEDNEDEPSQNSQEWETLSLVTESSTENFTLDYMKSVLECYDKHGWGRVQKRFKRPCTTRGCERMKTVQVHMRSCEARRDCTYNYCSASFQVLGHWKHCVDPDCPICTFVREDLSTDLLKIFPNPVHQAEFRQRIATQQERVDRGEDEAPPMEWLESEE
ncbi:CREB-binding protein [Folsomia candida]|uniref:histone acetyltransferase n=1 Tax=Folsomia candida TaxID=158441 RepID=A0A226CZX7_FOLCA|nr:CREB-binding protein [Folsomia candida]